MRGEWNEGLEAESEVCCWGGGTGVNRQGTSLYEITITGQEVSLISILNTLDVL